ncbi:MAG: 4Fe-4S binding protein [Proteobacteria bacterium]|nr:4Fe-4S binding protein [Pseudomonadota bacterium]
MAGLRDVAVHWYRRAFGLPAGQTARDEGLDTVLDGDTAVALAEDALASRVAGGAEGPRGVVAAATGIALAGRRATAFLSGTEALAAQDLLVSAAGKQAPLVLHLTSQAATAHGGATGSGHDTIHLCADAGFFLLFAANVQQAVDFTFVARRVAEDALVPGLVVMDGEQTARAAQDVRLPSPHQVSRFLGAAGDDVDAPTAAQRLLFGASRRRLPVWHDLDEPMLKGAVFDSRSFALGAAARRPFFDDYVSASLARACAEFGEMTGRTHAGASSYRMDGAETVIVAQGAALETAQLAADALRERHGTRAGVLGVHALRPFPCDAIATALESAARIVVLERTDAPLSGNPPLTRELRACLPAAAPVWRTGIYGIGGLPLRPEEIVAFAMADGPPGPRYLGVAFDDAADDRPKREVLFDALRRGYPDAGNLGLRAAAGDRVPPQSRSLCIRILRRRGDAGIVGAAAALMQRLDDGRIRSRCAAAADAAGTWVDWLVHGGDALLDPGDDPAADVTFDVAARGVTLHAGDRAFRVPDAGDGGIEGLLGGLFGALVAGGMLDVTARAVGRARRGLLESVDEAQRDRRLAAFDAGMQRVVEAPALPAAKKAPIRRATPPVVRALGRNDDHVASLPRFWDQTGVLYRDGETDRLAADPYLASGSLPPLSATLRDLESTRRSMPAFDPALCTGCGHCWTHCPDSAIGVVAAGPAALIDAGIRETGAEAVRQVAPKLASRIVSSGSKAETQRATFGEMLGDASAWLEEKAPLPEDRRLAIRDGVERIVAALGHLPLAVTKAFFHDAEARRKGSAELLSIVVNPDTCKACRICIRGCEPGALREAPRDTAVVEERRALWETWSATPDTTAASIERAADHPDVGPAAAMMLSRHCLFAMAGGDPAEAGSGQKLAVRLALAAAERHRQPIALRFAKDLAEAGAEIAGLLRETLSGTLPMDDLDAMAGQLEGVSTPHVDLATIAGRAGDGDRSVETAQLLRLIDLSKRLAAAHDTLVDGRQGLGRARYGLAVSGPSVAEWAAAYPGNPFQAPTLVDLSGDGAQLAAGLVTGHLDETVGLVGLLRRARLEVERPDGLDWKREALADLRWQELDEEERALCPPLILIGADDMLEGRGLSQLVRLLNSGLPVKVLLLSALALRDGTAGRAGGGAGLLALAQRDAYVAQTSIADARHLSACVSDALAFDGPALIQAYAPSPSRDGFATDDVIGQAGLAVAARVLPLFTYDPRREGVFGTRIGLDGNPQSRDDEPTFIDWARGQGRYASSLESPEMARAARRCAEDWQTLQELAGAVTPFTGKLETAIRAELEAEYRKALEARDAAAAAELAGVREKTRADIAGRLRDRLVELATRRRGGK